MAKPRDYKAEYLSRKARAQEKGFTGYGQQRYRAEKTKIELAKRKVTEEEWLNGQNVWGVPIRIGELMLEPKREAAYERLEASGAYTAAELAVLRNAPREDFWPIYRDLYQKLVM